MPVRYLYRNVELQAVDSGTQEALRLSGRDTLHTIVARSAAFRGRVCIQVALVDTPEDQDWAEVAKFDFAMHLPGGPIVAPLAESKAISITGRFAWMRVIILPVSGYINSVEIASS